MINEWIPVDEQLPPMSEEHRYEDLHWLSSEEVLGFADEGIFVIVQYTDSGDGEVAWVGSDGCEYSVTHWMPLPSPPDTEDSV